MGRNHSWSTLVRIFPSFPSSCWSTYWIPVCNLQPSLSIGFQTLLLSSSCLWYLQTPLVSLHCLQSILDFCCSIFLMWNKQFMCFISGNTCSIAAFIATSCYILISYNCHWMLSARSFYECFEDPFESLYCFIAYEGTCKQTGMSMSCHSYKWCKR